MKRLITHIYTHITIILVVIGSFIALLSTPLGIHYALKLNNRFNDTKINVTQANGNLFSILTARNITIVKGHSDTRIVDATIQLSLFSLLQGNITLNNIQAETINIKYTPPNKKNTSQLKLNSFDLPDFIRIQNLKADEVNFQYKNNSAYKLKNIILKPSNKNNYLLTAQITKPYKINANIEFSGNYQQYNIMLTLANKDTELKAQSYITSKSIDIKNIHLARDKGSIDGNIYYHLQPNPTIKSHISVKNIKLHNKLLNGNISINSTLHHEDYRIKLNHGNNIANINIWRNKQWHYALDMKLNNIQQYYHNIYGDIHSVSQGIFNTKTLTSTGFINSNQLGYKNYLLGNLNSKWNINSTNNNYQLLIDAMELRFANHKISNIKISMKKFKGLQHLAISADSGKHHYNAKATAKFEYSKQLFLINFNHASDSYQKWALQNPFKLQYTSNNISITSIYLKNHYNDYIKADGNFSFNNKWSATLQSTLTKLPFLSLTTNKLNSKSHITMNISGFNKYILKASANIIIDNKSKNKNDLNLFNAALSYSNNQLRSDINLRYNNIKPSHISFNLNNFNINSPDNLRSTTITSRINANLINLNQLFAIPLNILSLYGNTEINGNITGRANHPIISAIIQNDNHFQIPSNGMTLTKPRIIISTSKKSYLVNISTLANNTPIKIKSTAKISNKPTCFT